MPTTQREFLLAAGSSSVLLSRWGALLTLWNINMGKKVIVFKTLNLKRVTLCGFGSYLMFRIQIKEPIKILWILWSEHLKAKKMAHFPKFKRIGESLVCSQCSCHSFVHSSKTKMQLKGLHKRLELRQFREDNTYCVWCFINAQA